MCRVTFLPAGFLSRDSALDRTTSSVQNYHGILPPTRARAADRLPSTFAATACGGSAALTVPKKAVRRMGGPRRSGRRVHGWRHAKGGRARHPAHSRRVRPVEPPAHGPISKRQPFSLRSACFRWRSDWPAGLRVSKPQLVIARATGGGYSVQEARTQLGTTKRKIGLRSRGSEYQPPRARRTFAPLPLQPENA
jgi:hypothetical protein